MDWTTLILILLIWLSIGFIGYILIIVIERPKEDFLVVLLGALIGGPIFTVWMLKSTIQNKRERKENQLQLKLKKEKIKERLRAAKAAKKQRIAAEKVESKERYGKLLSELETQMKSYEESDEPPPKSFFVDAVTLGADACNIPKSGLENEETLMNVLRYARLNIYTVFEGNALKQGKTHADSLGSAIERLSR